jgi:hypothetical protein
MCGNLNSNRSGAKVRYMAEKFDGTFSVATLHLAVRRTHAAK